MVFSSGTSELNRFITHRIGNFDQNQFALVNGEEI